MTVGRDDGVTLFPCGPGTGCTFRRRDGSACDAPATVHWGRRVALDAVDTMRACDEHACAIPPGEVRHAFVAPACPHPDTGWNDDACTPVPVRG